MRPCQTPPELDPGVAELAGGDAMRALLRNKIEADARFSECRAKHKALVDFISE